MRSIMGETSLRKDLSAFGLQLLGYRVIIQRGREGFARNAVTTEGTVTRGVDGAERHERQPIHVKPAGLTTS